MADRPPPWHDATGPANRAGRSPAGPADDMLAAFDRLNARLRALADMTGDGPAAEPAPPQRPVPASARAVVRPAPPEPQQDAAVAAPPRRRDRFDTLTRDVGRAAGALDLLAARFADPGAAAVTPDIRSGSVLPADQLLAQIAQRTEQVPRIAHELERQSALLAGLRAGRDGGAENGARSLTAADIDGLADRLMRIEDALVAGGMPDRLASIEDGLERLCDRADAGERTTAALAAAIESLRDDVAAGIDRLRRDIGDRTVRPLAAVPPDDGFAAPETLPSDVDVVDPPAAQRPPIAGRAALDAEWAEIKRALAASLERLGDGRPRETTSEADDGRADDDGAGDDGTGDDGADIRRTDDGADARAAGAIPEIAIAPPVAAEAPAPDISEAEPPVVHRPEPIAPPPPRRRADYARPVRRQLLPRGFIRQLLMSLFAAALIVGALQIGISGAGIDPRGLTGRLLAPAVDRASDAGVGRTDGTVAPSPPIPRMTAAEAARRAVPAGATLTAATALTFRGAADPANAAGYAEAAGRGEAAAMHALGLLALSSVPADYVAAGRWFEAAARRGFADSQYDLAILLARGLGRPVDLASAYGWFALLAGAGDAEALRRLGAVRAAMSEADLIRARFALATAAAG